MDIPNNLFNLQKTVHVPEADRPVKPKIELFCGTCHKVLRSKRSYLCHIKSHRSTPKKCPFCCETFGRQSVLVRHIRVTHDPQYESSESKVRFATKKIRYFIRIEMIYTAYLYFRTAQFVKRNCIQTQWLNIWEFMPTKNRTLVKCAKRDLEHMQTCRHTLGVIPILTNRLNANRVLNLIYLKELWR